MTDPIGPIPFLDRLGEQLGAASPQPRRQIPIRALSIAAAVLLLVVGIGIAQTFRSDPVAAGVAITRSTDTVQVRISGQAPPAHALQSLLRRNGLTGISVDEYPASPEHVGEMFLLSFDRSVLELRVSQGDHPLGTYREGGSFDTIAFPKNWSGKLSIGLGRKAHGGEEYFFGGNALRRGGLLSCMQGATPAEVAAYADAHHLDVLWRKFYDYSDLEITRRQALALPGWRVESAIEANDHQVNVSFTVDGQPMIARLFSFVDGVPLHRVHQRSRVLRENLGDDLARLGLALKGFEHPATAGHELLWDLKHASRLRNLLAYIQDREQRALVERFLDNFERQFSFISVAKLVLAPTGATGLDEYLSGNLYTRVETLDLADVLDLERVPDLADPGRQQRFFVPIGAALRVEEGAA